MSCFRKRVAAGAALGAIVALAALFASSAPATTMSRCPSGGTPPAGSIVRGGLSVDGLCTLTNVTVSGGIVVEASSTAQVRDCCPNLLILSGSTVNGDVVVEEGSQILAGFDPFSGTVTGERATINGRVTLNDFLGGVLVNTTLRGGLLMNGGYDLPSICDGDPFCFSDFALCGDDVFGNVDVTDNNTLGQVFIGDAHEPFFANGDCAGNAIYGSISMENTNFIRFDGEPSEIEANTVTGSVHLDHSTAEVNENTVGGSLLCTNGTVIHPPAPDDVPGNTVRGQDTCD